MVRSLTSSAAKSLDSRGNPTVECDVLLIGHHGRAAVPSGTSTGSRRPSSCATATNRYLGKGVLKAVEHVNTEISEAVLNLDAPNRPSSTRPCSISTAPTTKSRLGITRDAGGFDGSGAHGNRRSGLPLYRYFGGSGGMRMPVPMMNVINGGAHANNNLDLQG